MAKKSTIWGWVTARELANERVVRRLPVVGFAALLAILYMTNSFSVQVKYRKINELRNELKMLKTTQVTTEAQRTALTRQQEIERRLAARGIALSDKGDPPITIW